MKFELGAKVMDKLSDFSGTIIARHEYLYSATQYTVKAAALGPTNGRTVEEHLPEESLELMATSAPAES